MGSPVSGRGRSMRSRSGPGSGPAPVRARRASAARSARARRAVTATGSDPAALRRHPRRNAAGEIGVGTRGASSGGIGPDPRRRRDLRIRLDRRRRLGRRVGLLDRMERHRDPVEPVDLDLRRVRDEQLLRELADHLVQGKPQTVSQVLGDLGLAQPDQVRRELIGDVAPRDPCHTFRELGDHELARDPQEAGVAEARRHLVLRREEGAGRKLFHDPVERDPQHHFRSARRAGRLRPRAGASRARRRDAVGAPRPGPARAAGGGGGATGAGGHNGLGSRLALARAAPRSGEPLPSSADAVVHGARAWRRGPGARRRARGDGAPLAGKAGARAQQVTERHQQQHHPDQLRQGRRQHPGQRRAPRAPDRATR